MSGIHRDIGRQHLMGKTPGVGGQRAACEAVLHAFRSAPRGGVTRGEQQGPVRRRPPLGEVASREGRGLRAAPGAGVSSERRGPTPSEVVVFRRIHALQIAEGSELVLKPLKREGRPSESPRGQRGRKERPRIRIHRHGAVARVPGLHPQAHAPHFRLIPAHAPGEAHRARVQLRRRFEDLGVVIEHEPAGLHRGGRGVEGPGRRDFEEGPGEGESAGESIGQRLVVQRGGPPAAEELRVLVGETVARAVRIHFAPEGEGLAAAQQVLILEAEAPGMMAALLAVARADLERPGVPRPHHRGHGTVCRHLWGDVGVLDEAQGAQLAFQFVDAPRVHRIALMDGQLPANDRFAGIQVQRVAQAPDPGVLGGIGEVEDGLDDDADRRELRPARLQGFP